MAVALYDPEETRSVVADWVELSLEASSVALVSSSLLTRAESIREDPDVGTEYDDESGEALDREILESSKDQWIDSIWQELDYRQRTLGTLYPYVLESSPAGWVLRLRSGGAAAERSARLAYRFCLLVSAFRYGMIEKAGKADAAFDSFVKSMPQHFQALSVIAGQPLLHGQVYWFGWPRPDDTNYPKALQRLVSLLGHGKVKGSAPAHSSGREKDGTVDIVAWRPFRDGHPGSLLLIGQVASGGNWRGKPVKAFINGDFFDWFEDRPGEHYVPALFIPFPLHDKVSPRGRYTFEEVAQSLARSHEMNYGTVVDRMRLVELTHDAYKGDDPGGYLRSAGPAILRWLASCRAYISPGALTVTRSFEE